MRGSWLHKIAVDLSRQIRVRGGLYGAGGDRVGREQDDHLALVVLRQERLAGNEEDDREDSYKQKGGEQVCNHFTKLHAQVTPTKERPPRRRARRVSVSQVELTMKGLCSPACVLNRMVPDMFQPWDLCAQTSDFGLNCELGFKSDSLCAALARSNHHRRIARLAKSKS